MAAALTLAEAARCAVRAARDCAAEPAPPAPSSAAAALRPVLFAAALAEAAFDGAPPLPDAGRLLQARCKGRQNVPSLHPY